MIYHFVTQTLGEDCQRSHEMTETCWCKPVISKHPETGSISIEHRDVYEPMTMQEYQQRQMIKALFDACEDDQDDEDDEDTA
jgi:hypothetical protein